MEEKLIGRIEPIDLVRVLLLIFLPIVHLYEEFTDLGLMPETANGGLILSWCGCIVGPSLFMMCLGMNVVFSKHATYKLLLKRGLQTLVISFALNATRFVLPKYFGYLMTGNSMLIVDAWEWFFMSDILTFAGLIFIFFAFMKKFNAQPLIIILIALVTLSINTIISPKPVLSGKWYHELLGNFIHATDFSAFPLLSWMIFPAVGYAIGSRMIKSHTNKELYSFVGKLGISGVVVCFTSVVCMRDYGLDVLKIAASPANNYITDLFSVTLDISISLVFMWIIFLIYRLIRSDAVKHCIYILSDAIMSYYVVQWVLVGWITISFNAFWAGDTVSTPLVLTLALIVTAVSIWLGVWHRKRKRLQKFTKE